MPQAARRQAQPAVPPLKQKLVPAPMGGLNAVSSLAAMPANDAVMLVNMFGGDMGLRSRLGYYEHALLGTTEPTVRDTSRVRSLLGFTASLPGDSRLFAATVNGIYDVTGSTLGVGAPVAAFPSPAGDAGIGACHVVVTSAGHFLAYTDEVNGYYLYKSGTWYMVGATGDGVPYMVDVGTTGDQLDPRAAVFCTVWKHRLWVVERNTANGWYFDLDAIAGPATKFSFAGKFRNGGHLVGLWSWTFDGGIGPDDYLVALSSAGDVVVYTGTDPSIPGAFAVKGSYYIGPPPAGRRVATDMGGDLALIGSNGLVPLSKLVLGSIQGDTTQFPTHKVTPTISRSVSSYGTYEGWCIKVHPSDNCLMIAIPTDTSDPGQDQLVLSNATKGWATYEGLPIACMESFQGRLYFGTADGRICINDGYLDNVLLSDPTTYTEIQFRGITAFDKYGSLRQKRVQFLRCNFTSDGVPPKYMAEARYRFNTTAPSGGTTVSKLTGPLWDVAIWDTDMWPGAQDFANEQRVVGSTGMGAEVAIAFAGKTTTRAVLIGFDVMYDEGGYF